MKTSYYQILIIVATIVVSSCSNNSNSAKEPASWKDLIQSAELTGWKKKGDLSAEFDEKILTLKGDKEPGWLIFEEEFEDFRFESEILLNSGNSADLVFRYPESMKGAPAFMGYKVNLDQNLDQQNPTGSIYNVARAKWLKSTKVDDWNKITIEAQGDHLKVMVNDTLVTEVHDRRSEEGLIGLGVDGGSVVQFRNLRIKELEEMDESGPTLEDFMRSYDQQTFEPMIKSDNLDDWSLIGEADWEINDGVIHGYSNKNGGFLVHKDAYQNFYLKLKFKIKHEDNSGIFIRHLPEEVDEVTTDNAIECNIYDHDGYTHEFSTGAIVPYARAWSKMIDYEDWNDMEIFAFDDHIIMFVNGLKSSEAHLPEKFNQKGNICIQGGIQVFNGNLPSDIYIKDMYIKDFDGIQSLWH